VNSLSVQWLTSDPGLLELDWLQQLLPGPMDQVAVHQDPDQVQLAENVLLITNSVCPYRQVLERFRRDRVRYGVVLLSDEYLRDPCEWLDDPQCLFLGRHYAHPAFLNHPKVFTFGLGYTRGFASQPQLFKPFDQRELAWCFAGTPHGDRADAVRLFAQLQPYRAHGCSGFMSSDGLGKTDYAALLGNSVFSLCPPGHASNDSYRLYESLEAGCIPVVLANSKQCQFLPSYWHAVFRGVTELPFIVGFSYADCFNQVCELIQSDAIGSMQISCQQFWSDWKSRWSRQLEVALSSFKPQ